MAPIWWHRNKAWVHLAFKSNLLLWQVGFTTYHNSPLVSGASGLGNCPEPAALYELRPLTLARLCWLS